ncbi:hypothetical protein F5Y09DRAFT_17076 [Xylaria sp. FL1042]|nr:hypothetical protein F5Y09DRAFT_17076 [Xylaria sp. FL1042]
MGTIRHIAFYLCTQLLPVFCTTRVRIRQTTSTLSKSLRLKQSCEQSMHTMALVDPIQSILLTWFGWGCFGEYQKYQLALASYSNVRYLVEDTSVGYKTVVEGSDVGPSGSVL